MVGIQTFERTLWAVTVLLEAGLAILLIYSKNLKAFRYFFIYIVADITQAAILFVSYRVWGFNSHQAEVVSWSTQAIVLVARALAVLEICRRVLARFRGIWALAWRLLLGGAILVLVYSALAASLEWQLFELNADRGLELITACVLVLLFAFAHYYQVTVETEVRMLAIGFFLYSSFQVLNDTVLERWRYDYAPLWNLIGSLAFLASLLLWGWAMRLRLPAALPEAELISGNVYQTLAPEINVRLKVLNESLKEFWYGESKRP